jgi:hypothetical protein
LPKQHWSDDLAAVRDRWTRFMRCRSFRPSWRL